MERLAGEDRLPVPGLGGQDRQQGAASEVNRAAGAPGKAVGRVRKREPVQDGGSDVWREKEDSCDNQKQKDEGESKKSYLKKPQ